MDLWTTAYKPQYLSKLRVTNYEIDSLLRIEISEIYNSALIVRIKLESIEDKGLLS